VQSFKTFIKSPENEEDMLALVEFSIFLEQMESNCNSLSEAIDIKGTLTGFLKKGGVHASKENRGLIEIMLKAGKHIGLTFFHAIKASRGNKESETILKNDLLKVKVKKAEIIDVLLRLDTLTMHLFTSPIHIIDALTGWHIAADIAHAGHNDKDKSKDDIIKRRLETALQTLDNARKNIPADVSKKISSFVRKLRVLFKPIIQKL